MKCPHCSKDIKERQIIKEASRIIERRIKKKGQSVKHPPEEPRGSQKSTGLSM